MNSPSDAQAGEDEDSRSALSRPSAASLVLILTVLGCFLTGCATTPDFKEVKQPARPFQKMGVFFFPPVGPGWYVLEDSKKGKWNVLFNERSESAPPTNTRYVRVSVEKVEQDVWLDQFPTVRAALQSASEGFEKPPPSDRFRMLTNSSVFGKFGGVECLRHRQTVEERGDPRFPETVLIMETERVVCFHPQNISYALLVTVSQRYKKGTRFPPLIQATDAFLQGLKFIPL